MINWSRDERWVSPWMIEVVRIPRGVINKSLQKQAHIEQFHWDFVNTRESRIVRISWLLFVDCTTILPNLYSWLKFSCSVVNPFSICNSIRCNINFLQNIPKIFCSRTFGNYESLLLSWIFHIQVIRDQVDVYADMKLWKILVSFSKGIVERFDYANLYLWCSSLNMPVSEAAGLSCKESMDD